MFEYSFLNNFRDGKMVQSVSSCYVINPPKKWRSELTSGGGLKILLHSFLWWIAVWWEFPANKLAKISYKFVKKNNQNINQ
jgi:hypothetical protein